MNLNKIIATGLVASEDFIENLAVAVAANENLARMLAGDLKFPSEEEAINKISREYPKRSHLKIRSMEYTSEFNIRIMYGFIITRFVKDMNDGYYDSVAQITDDHLLAKEFTREDSYTWHV